MSENATPDAVATPENNSGFEAITSQEDLNAIIKDRVQRERNKFKDYADLQAQAAELAELKTAQLSEAEKERARAEKLEREIQELKTAKELSELASAKGIPMNTLTGTPEERAEAIAALVAEAGKPRTPAPDPSQGRTPTAMPLNGDGLEDLLMSKLNGTR